MTKTEIIVKNLSITDAGEYTCIAENLANSIRSDSTTVKVLTRPKIILKSTVVYLSKSATRITCAASGMPIPSVDWSKNGKILTSPTFGSVELEVTQEGLFTCRAENSQAKVSDDSYAMTHHY